MCRTSTVLWTYHTLLQMYITPRTHVDRVCIPEESHPPVACISTRCTSFFCLQRYGKSWDPATDSLHLMRADPLTDSATVAALADEPYDSVGEMRLGESVDPVEQDELLALFSGIASGAAGGAIDPSFFESSSDEDEEAGGVSRGDPLHVDGGAGGSGKGGIADAGPPPWLQRRKARRRAPQRGGGGGPPAHYTVLSPFEPPRSAMNLAGASYEGRKIGRYFEKTLRSLSLVRTSGLYMSERGALTRVMEALSSRPYPENVD